MHSWSRYSLPPMYCSHINASALNMRCSPSVIRPLCVARLMTAMGRKRTFKDHSKNPVLQATFCALSCPMARNENLPAAESSTGDRQPAGVAVHALVSVNIREDSALLEVQLHAHSGKLAPPSTSSTSPPGTSYRHGQKAAFRASLRFAPLAFIFKESDAVRLESAGRSTRDSAPPSNRRRGESHAWRNHRQKY